MVRWLLPVFRHEVGGERALLTMHRGDQAQLAVDGILALTSNVLALPHTPRVTGVG
jgi:hypothetical protein